MRRLAVTAILLAVGCKGFTEACTLIGCLDGIQVVFDTTPTTAFRVEATDGVSQKQVFECQSSCLGAYFPNYMPEDVTITVITSAGSRTFVRKPEYKTSQPNGPRCGPTCRSATVTVSMP